MEEAKLRPDLRTVGSLVGPNARLIPRRIDVLKAAPPGNQPLLFTAGAGDIDDCCLLLAGWGYLSGLDVDLLVFEFLDGLLVKAELCRVGRHLAGDACDLDRLARLKVLGWALGLDHDLLAAFGRNADQVLPERFIKLCAGDAHRLTFEAGWIGTGGELLQAGDRARLRR